MRAPLGEPRCLGSQLPCFHSPAPVPVPQNPGVQASGTYLHYTRRSHFFLRADREPRHPAFIPLIPLDGELRCPGSQPQLPCQRTQVSRLSPHPTPPFPPSEPRHLDSQSSSPSIPPPQRTRVSGLQTTPHHPLRSGREPRHPGSLHLQFPTLSPPYSQRTQAFPTSHLPLPQEPRCPDL